MPCNTPHNSCVGLVYPLMRLVPLYISHVFVFLFAPFVLMRYTEKMVDRQVGRNAELFSRAVADLETPEERYPYLRILVSLVEQAHPEWRQAPTKEDQIATLLDRMSQGQLDEEEVKEVVRVRDEEQGYYR